MTPKEHAGRFLQTPAVQEVLNVVDPGLRAAVVHALLTTIREARHEERLRCAKIVIDVALAAPWTDEQGLADQIAATILARDTNDEESRSVGDDRAPS